MAKRNRPSSLPSANDLGQSVSDDSTTLILRHENSANQERSTRTPHIAEIDLTTDDPLQSINLKTRCCT